jgi:hypothetical protein
MLLGGQQKQLLGGGGGWWSQNFYRRETEDKTVVCGKNETPVVRALLDCGNIQDVSFIVAPNTTDLWQRQPAYAEVSRDSCGSQESDKIHSLHPYLHIENYIRRVRNPHGISYFKWYWREENFRDRLDYMFLGFSAICCRLTSHASKTSAYNSVRIISPWSTVANIRKVYCKVKWILGFLPQIDGHYYHKNIKLCLGKTRNIFQR